MIYLVPIIGTAMCWLLSLRRTPWATIWFYPCVFFATIGCVEIMAVKEVHHTAAGMLGVCLASVTPAMFFAFTTEVAADDAGKIMRWRDRHKAATPNVRGRLGSR